MGSLSSRPTVPSAPTQIITVPTSTTVTSSSADGGENASGQSAVDSLASTRAESLLSRERGRFGTIATSFRGLLDAESKNARTKTLLGE